jgi:hypothetical protein
VKGSFLCRQICERSVITENIANSGVFGNVLVYR